MKCQITQIPESEFERAFLRLYYKLRHHGMPVLSQLLTDLQTAQNRKLLWSLDIVELNKQIADIVRQERLLAELKQQGLVDPDIYITRSNTLAEQLRTAKLEKERFLESEEDQTIRQTQVLLEILETGPEFLEAFDEELFSELVAKIIVENNEHKSRIKQVYQENELVSQRLKAASIAMSAYAAELTEWDQSVVYQLVEKVTVLAKDKIRVTFRNGTEVEQEIEQLDWRNAS